MFKILSNEVLAENVHRIVVEAPRIAKARHPGQFVIVRAVEGAERIPLTIADADATAGTITLIIQAVGAGTKEIVTIPVGGAIRDVAGPLGKHTAIELRQHHMHCEIGGAEPAWTGAPRRPLSGGADDLQHRDVRFVEHGLLFGTGAGGDFLLHISPVFWYH